MQAMFLADYKRGFACVDISNLSTYGNQELEAKEYTATSGGGAVSVTLTGKMELTKIDISPDVVDAEDVEMLSDLIIAATNEALRAARKEKEDTMETISGGLNIPGMF